VPDDGHFDQEVAESYDDPEWDMTSPEKIDPVVDFLVEQCRGGDALEFGVGTGRIALPLAQRGLQVSGIDISRPMVGMRIVSRHAGWDREPFIGESREHVSVWEKL
jgi:2-polyprenyl-3-methyl-5-hydroxy-6-metoxy-1,4-benzoquinol methylase